MKWIVDRCAYLDSPIHPWQQQYKLIGMISFILAFSLVQNLIQLKQEAKT